MTDEQKLQRKKSAEIGHIKWIKDKCLRTKDSKENYVFISYKSDNYEKVLDDIVFKACKKYGLKVYFDTAFDDNTDSWINQFYDNMTSAYCKASFPSCLILGMKFQTDGALHVVVGFNDRNIIIKLCVKSILKCTEFFI